jgi:hypothetical protein
MLYGNNSIKSLILSIPPKLTPFSLARTNASLAHNVLLPRLYTTRHVQPQLIVWKTEGVAPRRNGTAGFAKTILTFDERLCRANGNLVVDTRSFLCSSRLVFEHGRGGSRCGRLGGGRPTLPV